MPTSAFRPSPAPVWHTGLVLTALAIFSGFGAAIGMASAAPKLSHPVLFPIITGTEWVIFGLMLWRTTPGFRDYLAGALRNPRSLPWDLLVALLLLTCSFLLAPLVVHLLGPSGWPSLAGMHPRNGLELALWIPMALSAGVCEEAIFRGYLQQQFAAWTRSQPAAVLSQAVLFSLCHIYQGWKNVALIFVLGCLFGVFALWRKGLRANMLAHAIADVLSGL